MFLSLGSAACEKISNLVCRDIELRYESTCREMYHACKGISLFWHSISSRRIYKVHRFFANHHRHRGGTDIDHPIDKKSSLFIGLHLKYLLSFSRTHLVTITRHPINTSPLWPSHRPIKFSRRWSISQKPFWWGRTAFMATPRRAIPWLYPVRWRRSWSPRRHIWRTVEWGTTHSVRGHHHFLIEFTLLLSSSHIMSLRTE